MIVKKAFNYWSADFKICGRVDSFTNCWGSLQWSRIVGAPQSSIFPSSLFLRFHPPPIPIFLTLKPLTLPALAVSFFYQLVQFINKLWRVNRTDFTKQTKKNRNTSTEKLCTKTEPMVNERNCSYLLLFLFPDFYKRSNIKSW